MKIKHLPLSIDPKSNRYHYYELLWKEVAFRLLKKAEPKLEGWSLLDYGCGRGEALQIGLSLGMKVVGTDIEDECLAVSRKIAPVQRLNPSDPVAQFGAKSFDVVACFHVLEHVPSPVQTLNNLREIARKYLLLAVPNLSAFHDLLRPKRWLDPVNEGHLQSWDHATFLNLMEKHCSLKLVEWGFDAVIIPPISSLINRFFGNRFAIALETGLFKCIHPYASHSVIALAKPTG
ncbi:MAG: class I SAM-dependent methyltransferase [Methylacidiphilales bacterium]|nr:class I SAM-dependent methyltransferase [Candidatus Methylacidiphilales bacterium]MDW8349702.1 class I SAM-dependent methyltransferase [Verrucomicrobiae bacterium]